MNSPFRIFNLFDAFELRAGGSPSTTSRYVPTLSGSQYWEFASAQSLSASDTVEFEFSTASTGAAESLCDCIEFDAGDLLQLTNCTATIDGVAVADGASVASYRDGKKHTLVATMTGSQSITVVGQSGSATKHFEGQIFKLDLNGEVYNFDSGSTVQEVGSLGTVATAYNFTSTNWDTYTYQTQLVHDGGTIAAAWIGPELVPDPEMTNPSLWYRNAEHTANVTHNGSAWVWDGDEANSAVAYPSSDGSWGGRVLLAVDSVYMFEATIDAMSDPRLKFAGSIDKNMDAAGQHRFVEVAASDTPNIQNQQAPTVAELGRISIKHLIEVA